MREEKAKKDAKDRIRTIKAVIHPEVVAAGEGKSSTLVAQVAKKLLTLTLVALLAEEGGALGQSSGHCYVTTLDSASTAPRALGTIFALSFVIFVVVFVMTILLRFIWRLQRQISQLKEVVMNARQALQDSRGQWRERQTHAGVYFEESETEVASEELDLHAYSVRVEETMDIEQNLESELGEESDVEIEVEVEGGGDEHQGSTEPAGDGTFEEPGAALALLDDGYGGTTTTSIPPSSHAGGGRGVHGDDGAGTAEDAVMDLASAAVRQIWDLWMRWFKSSQLTLRA